MAFPGLMDSRTASPPLLPQAVYSHAKVALTCRPARPLFVAGQQLDGILELACSSDKVWLGAIALEIRGAEQLHSRDHAASQAFMQSDVTFQSSDLPPSNAVTASASHSGFWPARKRVTRFPFSFAIPSGCPSSCRFAGNASVTYTLLASCQIQLEGERSILTRRLDVNVVEYWQDWHAASFHEASEAQVREKVQPSIGGIGLAKGEGTVTVQASIRDPALYRGWQIADRSLEIERARGEIHTHLSIINASSRTISGLKVTLLRRLKILPDSEMPKNRTVVISAASAPRITEIVEEINLHGRGWQFPPSNQATVADCIVPLPESEKFLSIRKTKLFEIHTLVKVSLDLGTLNKPIIFELPIWVAHWASLPASARQSREAVRPPISRPMSSQGLMRAHGAVGLTFGDAAATMDSYGRRCPMSGSPFAMVEPTLLRAAHPPQPGPHGSFTTSSPKIDLQNRIQEQEAAFIPFDPHTPTMTPSRFLGQDAPWSYDTTMDARNWAPLHSSSQQQCVPISLASSAPASSYFQMLARERMSPLPNLPEKATLAHIPSIMMRPQSADSGIPNAGTASHYAPRGLPPRMQDCLTDEEQARVLANSMPAVYDIAERAHALGQQHNVLQTSTQRNRSLSGNASSSLTGRERRQSMPTPPSVAQSHSTPTEAGLPFRPNKTPPLAPSSRFITQIPLLPASISAEVSAGVAGLETIGEDGESQAGTIRFGKDKLVRSASHEQIRSLKAVRAVNSAVDEEGNTSVSLLEGIAERQGRERDAANRREELERRNDILAGLELTEPDTPLFTPAPSATRASSQDDSSRPRKRIFDIFPEIESSKDVPRSCSDRVARPPSTMDPPQIRGVSTTVLREEMAKPSLAVQLSRPVIKSSKSDTLLALESRLSRPSPMSPKSAEARFQPISPPSRFSAVSPVHRAVSPVHIGNQGALRKKSSKIALKQQRSQTGSDIKQPYSELDPSLPVGAKSQKEALVQSEDAEKSPEGRSPLVKHALQTTAEGDRVRAAQIGSTAPPTHHQPRNAPARAVDHHASGDTTPAKIFQNRSAEAGTAAFALAPGQRSTFAPHSPGRPLASSSPASGKRHTSDPQVSSTSQASLKVDTAAKRRQSLDISSEPVDKFGSARGGRGGHVASVASLWTDIISQEAKNARNQATLSTTAPATSQRKPVADQASQTVLKARDQLCVAVTKAKSTTNTAGNAPEKCEDVRTKDRYTESRRPTIQAPKAQQAAASINATLGRPPTFAKARGPPANTAKPPAIMLPAQSATNLRALIAKFS